MIHKVRLRARYAFTLSVLLVVAALLVSVVHLLDALRTEEAMRASSSKAMHRALNIEIEESGLGLTRMLADSLVEPLIKSDFRRIYNITSAARRLASVSTIELYDSSGTVVHDGTIDIMRYGQQASPEVVTAVLVNGEWLTTRQDNLLRMFAPVTVENQILGALRLEIDLIQSLGQIERLDAELERIADVSWRNSILSTVIMAILLCAGGIAIARAIAARLSSPIHDLANLTREIGRGNFKARVPWQRSDELGELADSLHRMAKTIEQSTVSEAELEARIFQRTRELERVNRELRHLDRSRRQFFAEVSHELRTPLTVIRGEAEVTLRSRQLSINDTRQTLQHVVELTKGLSKLVEDLLFIARSETTPLPLVTKSLFLDQLVSSVCDEMKVFAGDRGLEVVAEDLPENAHILGDRQRIKQLLMILLENAVKHSGGSSRVNVSLRLDEGEAVLLVCNDGAGITAAELGRVFDPFYRGSQARRRGARGSGLGLAVAKRIVEAHGGMISVESNPGVNTSVTVRLPLVAAPPELLRASNLERASN